MKTMLWMRHGKSNWDADYGRDHDRPLAPRGVKAAHAIGTALARSGFVPDFILSSTAVRARSTAELAASAIVATTEDTIVDPVPTRHEQGLYGGGVGAALDLVRTVPDDEGGRRVDTLLITGHEPTWSGAVSQLIGGGELRFVTAAVACLRCRAARWRDVGPGTCELIFFLPPKVLAKLC
ncbi:MAG: histidine phosphatase family protein [Thermoanaerobaculia bacterium]|nr:histidine phosphatase family protein [Thermoanaerobaculia bacterium]